VTANVEHTASETPHVGYTASIWGGDCAADGTITLLPGDVKTCTITNDDVALAPSIALQKLTNGQDADTPPGPYIEVGDPVTWTYLVTNTGNITLTQVSVTDDQEVEVACPRAELAPGAGMVCQATGTATAGPYTNLGTVVASPIAGSELVSADDPSHYFGARLSIHLEKRTNGIDADVAPGPTIPVDQPVLWTYIVTNTGTVQLADIIVWDDQEVSVSCPRTALDPDETMVCTGSGVAKAGQYKNMGTVVAHFGEVTISDTDSSHYWGLPDLYLYLPLVLH
jgi:hypothetical protein